MVNSDKLETISKNAMKSFKSVAQSKTWLTINQKRINQFADATLDHQFIHVDLEAAKTNPWGKTIAHGFLILSLLPHLISSHLKINFGVPTVMVINYGTDKVRFINPVTVDSKIRASSKLINIIPKPAKQGLLLKSEITIHIKGQEKPALIAESLMLYILKI